MTYRLPVTLIGMMLFISAQAISQVRPENDVPDLAYVKTTLSKEIQKILT